MDFWWSMILSENRSPTFRDHGFFVEHDLIRKPEPHFSGSCLKREAGAAAAGGSRLWIVDLERRSDQVIDEVDLSAGHVVERDGIDQHGGAGPLDHDVIVRLGALGVEFVLEPGAAAARDADAQHGAGRLLAKDFA